MQRKVELEASAFAGRAAGDDGALVLGDDSVDERQSESRALPGGFGGEERIERALEDFLGHSGAVVLDDDAHRRALGRAVASRERKVDNRRFDRHEDAPSRSLRAW